MLAGCSGLKLGGDSSSPGGGGAGGGGGSGAGGGDAAAGGSTSATHHYTGKLTGTVLYRERFILPQDAVVVVRLVDVTKPAAPVVLAEKQLKAGGKGPPYSFAIDYDPAKITETSRYQVQSEILVRTSRRFTTQTPPQVITQGFPSTFDIVLQSVRQ